MSLRLYYAAPLAANTMSFVSLRSLVNAHRTYAQRIYTMHGQTMLLPPSIKWIEEGCALLPVCDAMSLLLRFRLCVRQCAARPFPTFSSSNTRERRHTHHSFGGANAKSRLFPPSRPYG